MFSIENAYASTDSPCWHVRTAHAEARVEAEREQDSYGLSLWGVEVDAAQRGKGYGAALLRAVLRLCWRMRPAFLRLQVYSKNAAAIALYRKCGFRETERYGHMITMEIRP